jgi:hypothetical protein
MISASPQPAARRRGSMPRVHRLRRCDRSGQGETFWSDFARVLGSVSAHGQYDSIRQQVDDMLRIYMRRSEYYRTQPPIEAAYRASGDSVQWLISIVGNSSDSEQMRESLMSSSEQDGDQWIQQDFLGLQFWGSPIQRAGVAAALKTRWAKAKKGAGKPARKAAKKAPAKAVQKVVKTAAKSSAKAATKALAKTNPAATA